MGNAEGMVARTNVMNDVVLGRDVRGITPKREREREGKIKKHVYITWEEYSLSYPKQLETKILILCKTFKYNINLPNCTDATQSIGALY